MDAPKRKLTHILLALAFALTLGCSGPDINALNQETQNLFDAIEVGMTLGEIKELPQMTQTIRRWHTGNEGKYPPAPKEIRSNKDINYEGNWTSDDLMEYTVFMPHSEHERGSFALEETNAIGIAYQEARIYGNEKVMVVLLISPDEKIIAGKKGKKN